MYPPASGDTEDRCRTCSRRRRGVFGIAGRSVCCWEQNSAGGSVLGRDRVSVRDRRRTGRYPNRASAARRSSGVSRLYPILSPSPKWPNFAPPLTFSTSLKLTVNGRRSQTAWLMISGGKRWRRYRNSIGQLSPTGVNLTMPSLRIVMNTSSTCQMSPSRPCRRREVRAYAGPNFRRQDRMAS